MGQGAEVSGNVCFCNDSDLYLEVNHGPVFVANNIFLSPLAHKSISRGTAYAHNLFAGRVFVTDTARETPYLKPHSTSVAGYHGNAPGDDHFYNNIYVVTSPVVKTFYVLREYNDPELPVTMRDNLYMGVLPHPDEVSPMVQTKEVPILKPVQKKDGIYIEWISQAEWTNTTRQIVTSDLLGRAGVSGARYEHPDGSPIRVNRDFFGHPRNEQNPMPGPFELPAGKVLLQIWPKK